MAIPRTAWVAGLLVCFAKPPAPQLAAQVLQYGDRDADHLDYVDGCGALIVYDAGDEGLWLNGVEAYVQPLRDSADAEIDLYVVDIDGRVLCRVALPYDVLGDAEGHWCRLPIPPFRAPREFALGLTLAREPGLPRVYRDDERFLRMAGPLPESGGFIGTYDVGESHSYRWTPDTSTRVGLGTGDWMVRAYMGGEPDGEVGATDLILLHSGEAYIDRVLSAEGDPLDVITAGHGPIHGEQVATIRLEAATAPVMSPASVTLADGTRVQCTLLSIDERSVRVRDTVGSQRSFARADVLRIDLGNPEPSPIGAQPEP